MGLGFFNPLPLFSSIPLHLQSQCLPCLWDGPLAPAISVPCLWNFLCLWAQSCNFFKLSPLLLGFLPPLPLFSSIPAFGDDWISYPFGLHSHVLLGIEESISYLFQTQTLVFGILQSLTLFQIKSVATSISVFCLWDMWDILAPFFGFRMVQSQFFPWFWDCSIPQPLWAQSLGPFWALSLDFGIVQSLWPLQSQCLGFGIVQYFYPSGTQSFGPFNLSALSLGLLNPFCFMSSNPQVWNFRGQILLLAHICSYNIHPASLIEDDSLLEVALLIKPLWPPDSGTFMGCGHSQGGKWEKSPLV